MANRFATSFGPVPSLGCQTIFGLATSPVSQTTDGNGVVISASIDTAILQVSFTLFELEDFTFIMQTTTLIY